MASTPISISSDEESIRNLDSIHISPEHGPHTRRICAQDAVAMWLNNIGTLADNDVFAEEDDTEEGNHIYGHEVGPDMIPYMGFHPESIQDHGLLVTSNGRSRVTVREIIDVLYVPEYPFTDPEGVGTFVHISEPLLREGATEAEIRGAFLKIKDQIQFDIGRPTRGSNKFSKTHLRFLSHNRRHSLAYHMSYVCSGVRVCGHTDPSIVSTCSAYDRVNIEYIEESQRRLGPSRPKTDIQTQLKEHTENQFQAYTQTWIHKGEFPCTTHNDEPSCGGQVMKAFRRNNVLMVGCPRSSDAEPWHTAWSIPRSSARIDLPYLEALCMSSICIPQETCTWIGHVGQRRKFCGYDHPSGPKETRLQTCPVIFDIYIPANTHRFPYIFLVSRGSHSHHPPLPHKPPKEIIADIVEAIQSIDMLGLRTRQFLMSPTFYNLKQRYGDETLRAISASLNLEDRITLLIRKQRLLQYPEGCSLAGVQREYSLQQQLSVREQWIRQIHYLEDGHWIIICCTYAQAMRFTAQQFLEIDLSFKMVAGKPTLFSITGWDDQVNRTDTYAYAFLSRAGLDIYQLVFRLIFDTISNITGEFVKWHHIHSGAGIHVVTADMDGAQAHGLGEYLHMLDPSRDWEEHLQYILIFCQVHIRRNFRKRFPNHPVQHTLHTLWECDSREAYAERVRGITAAYPELKNWFQGKMKPWMVSAFVQSESKVPKLSWAYARKNSNLAEVSHFEENNAVGRKLTLLTAMLGLRKFCIEKDEKRNVQLQTGQEVTWRNTSSQARLQKQVKAKEVLHRQQAERRRTRGGRPYNPLNPFDSEDADAEHMPGTGSVYSENTEPSITGLPPIRPPSINPSSSGRSSPMPGMSSAYAGDMPPPSSSSRKRNYGSQSFDSGENAAYAERMQNLRRERDRLLAEKGRREMALREEIRELQRSLGES